MKTYNIKHVNIWNGESFSVRVNLAIDEACAILRNLKTQKIAQGYTITENACAGVAEYNYFCYADERGIEYMVKINLMQK